MTTGCTAIQVRMDIFFLHISSSVALYTPLQCIGPSPWSPPALAPDLLCVHKEGSPPAHHSTTVQKDVDFFFLVKTEFCSCYKQWENVINFSKKSIISYFISITSILRGLSQEIGPYCDGHYPDVLKIPSLPSKSLCFKL